ncbi:MAG: UDP-N-acetylmuramoyl-L-alanine--D-glutamate ligase [Syntrophales bacterium]|nr:UDP-N-acetylmuramoyl-L-alanine--D-glutamate ligase [Syntrophales bacterium]
MDVAGKTIAIIGLGKTGMAAAEFFVSKGARVRVTDEKIGELDLSLLEGVEVRDYNDGILVGVDLVVPSPGVPPHNCILVAAREKKIPVLSELEVAFRFLHVPVVAVTGTNGKTTTVTLIGRILSEAKKRVFVGGNIGVPLISYVNGPQDDEVAVVEVSSFQLLWTDTFHPYIGVLLNVTQDHIDYHGSMAAYREAKESMFIRQQKDDYAILNADEEETEVLKEKLVSQVITFSTQERPLPPCLYLDGDSIVYRTTSNSEEVYPLSMLKIPGLHNVENFMAAIACARLLGCTQQEIERAARSFTGVPHRIELVAEIDGVKFIDDSKGTNCDAVKRALETFSEPVVLLMGGRDKDSDFSVLVPVVTKHVKTLIAFGEARERIAAAFGDKIRLISVPTLKEGVKRAKSEAVRGDVVLLSPGCASFDEFQNYRERGMKFREWIKEDSYDQMG